MRNKINITLATLLVGAIVTLGFCTSADRRRHYERLNELVSEARNNGEVTESAIPGEYKLYRLVAKDKNGKEMVFRLGEYPQNCVEVGIFSDSATIIDLDADGLADSITSTASKPSFMGLLSGDEYNQGHYMGALKDIYKNYFGR